jgi:hypothetical protein
MCSQSSTVSNILLLRTSPALFASGSNFYHMIVEWEAALQSSRGCLIISETSREGFDPDAGLACVTEDDVEDGSVLG